jgi:hypothetical protein
MAGCGRSNCPSHNRQRTGYWFASHHEHADVRQADLHVAESGAWLDWLLVRPEHLAPAPDAIDAVRSREHHAASRCEGRRRLHLR